MKKLSFIILLLFFNIFFIIIIPINTKAISDIPYTFVDNILYENNDIQLQESFNLRYVGNYTDIYNASYSFTNESDYSNPSYFLIDETAGSVNVIPSFDNHNKVLELNDTDGVPAISVQQFFSSGQVSGTYELWFQTADCTPYSYMYGTGIGNGVRIYVRDENFYAHEPGGATLVRGAVDNTWYHVRVDFETGAGSYLGLGADTYFLTINGVQYGAYAFNTPQTEILTLLLLTSFVSANFDYFDAIGYSWLSNYSIGNNIIPFLNESETLQEIDRYEFAMSAIDTFHPTGADSTNGWTDIEVGGGDKVGIAIQGNVNGLIYSSTNVLSDQRGTKKINLGINGEFINVSVAIQPQVIDGVLNEIIIDIYSSDDLYITGLIINADLSVIVSTGSGNLDLNRDITLMRSYEFNFFLNYELDMCYLIYTQDGVVQEIYDYTLVDDDKEGLDRIEVYSFNTDANSIEYFIDYIGIYNNGIPQIDSGVEFALTTRVLTGASIWNYEHNNLLNIRANGTFHFGVVSDIYFRGATLYTILPTLTYDMDILGFINMYDNFSSEISLPRLVITLVNGYFNFTYIKITGVALNQSLILYNLIYEHSGILTRESYFYVVNNQLRFNHIANDTNSEYIQARFNVNDVSSDGYTFSFKSFITNNAFGIFRVNFTTTSNLIEISRTERTTRYSLSQNLTIRDFIILITDNDDNSISGLTTGFVSEIQLIDTANIGVSIITVSLIGMMIPIIMILIPTFAISNRYGTNTIIPIFLLMSLICVVASLIPVWLFFIIAISNTLFILKTSKIKEVD